MFQEMMVGSGGGSGAYGTCTDTTGNAQTVTINTGLSSVNRFMITCKGNTAANNRTALTFNRNESATQYKAVTRYGTSGSDITQNIGTASGSVYVPQIFSISGGTVTLKTPASAQGSITDAWWMACS